MSISDVLCFGEILWDIFPGGKSPGGAPMTVAIHLSRLGVNVRFASRIADDQPGKELVGYLESIDFRNFYLQRDPIHSTGRAQVDTSDPNNPGYHFPDSAWDYIELNQELLSLARLSDTIVYGSLIAREPKSYDTLIQLIGDKEKYKVFDVNLRYPHYTKKLIQELLEKANLVKMNQPELMVIRDWFFRSSDEKTLLKQLRDRFDCEMISVTHGKHGASLLSGDQYLRHDGYYTHVKDTIGAGDAFLAGLIRGIMRMDEPEKVLDNAVALGAYVSSRSGANPFYQENDIEQFKENSGF